VSAYDVIIVGGGPAGSTCARALTRAGARVAIVDRAQFPRVKLCAGWLSAPIWDVLELAPREYPRGLWPWDACHVHYRGEAFSIACRGWFIRRYELDDFLLHRSGATLHLGVNVKAIEKDGDLWWNVGGLRARHLVGAGGTHCPVARIVDPPRPRGVVGVQEHEFQTDGAAVARTRLGGDGEPELLLHDDLRGYAWNVPKSDWLNVGVGTLDPGDVRDAWQRARVHFVTSGHVPEVAEPGLDHMKGHSYYLFDPVHLDGAVKVDADGKGGAYLVGDSLGLAQPLTAEGILPATLSGRLCGEAIASGNPAAYPARLRAHRVIADYARVFELREAAGSLRRGNGNGNTSATGAGASRASRLASRAIATGFAWMFSGARLPAPRVIDLVLAGARRVRDRRAKTSSGGPDA
jgi:flavin-dependent dehydrogenase